jgi:6-pyruvoyltetrahydropterin/6-carboxytetrahydropterin synthase
MYYLKKTLEISASHCLELDYDSKCQNIHGHNWIIEVYCKSNKLNKNGMIVDFIDIKKIVKGKFDHKNLNKVLGFNPTAENIAKWIQENVKNCYKVKIQESTGNVVWYEI